MSIRLEKYIGYSIGIDKDLYNIDSQLAYRILYEIDELKSIVKDSRNGRSGDMIILNYDFDGKFTKLFYILEKEDCCYEEESSNVNNKINELLSSVSVPPNIYTLMLKAYKDLFGALKSLEIKAEFIINYV